MHYENLGSSWMLGGSLPDSNKLLRIFTEFQCILFVLLLEVPISFNLWQQDTRIPNCISWYYQEQKDYGTICISCYYQEQKDAKTISWWGAVRTSQNINIFENIVICENHLKCVVYYDWLCILFFVLTIYSPYTNILCFFILWNSFKIFKCEMDIFVKSKYHTITRGLFQRSADFRQN